MSFTHLHLHTEYSLLDGACRIPKLVERIKALGMTSCAITDHGVMYGCIDFYSAMKDAGIKPIIGCEVYVCRDRLDKSAANREYSHLILLCENNTGYQNLMKLVSEGFLTGYYYRPRIDYNLIRQHSEGLICLSACLSGDLPKLLLQGRYDDAEAYVREMQDIFGEKSFYVEIMDHGIREEKIVMPRLISLAREMNVPLVATNDCHYLEEKDADAQEVLLCIQTGKTLDDANRMRMDTRQLYVKSEDEMRTLFAACPDAVERTQEIADRCNVEFEFGVTRLPHYPVPEGETALSMLTRLTHEGFRFDWKTVQNILVVGIPSTIMQAISSVCTTLMNMILAGFGDIYVNVLGVYFKLQSFVFMPVFGLCNGMVPIVGYNFGAQKKKRVYECVRVCLVYALVIMAVGALLFLAVPNLLMMPFDSSADKALTAEGCIALRIICSHFLIAAAGITLSTVFQAVGRGTYSLIMSLCRQLIVLLPATWALSLIGPNAIWWAFPIAEIVSLTICLLLYRKCDRELIAPLPEE